MHLILPLGFIVTPVLGWLAGIPWLTVLIAAVLLPLGEWLIGRSSAPAPRYRWHVWTLRLAMLLAWLVPTAFALHADRMEWDALIWLALSCGYVSGGIGIVLAHELGHRRSLIDRSLARLQLCSIAYGHYVIEHNRGHHRHAATLPDPATARAHEGLWRFMPRYFSGVYADALRLSRQRAGWINEALALSGATLLMAAAVFAVAGWKGVAFGVIQSWLALSLVAAIDYVEHWGLQRELVDGKPVRMGPQHTWDCANRLSDALLFNLPRHSSHHLEPSLDCDALYRVPESPQMPTGYAGMVVLACVPPLYKQIMRPRLPPARQMAT